jgi:hypothetical protein
MVLVMSSTISLPALLEDVLLCRPARRPSSSVPAFRLHTVRGKVVDPNMDLDRTSALVVMEDEATTSEAIRVDD